MDAIPASHSIFVEVLDKLGGRPGIAWLVRAGDPLQKKGKITFKAAESLKAGSAGSLNIKLWEGEIGDPITDNRPIGVLKISGSDFDDGVIYTGADLECEYEIQDSGCIVLEVNVPCIGAAFHSGRNFYSWQKEGINYASYSAFVVEEGKRTLSRLDDISGVVEDPKLEQAREKLQLTVSLDPQEADPEKTKEADERIHKTRRILAQVRTEHLKKIRQIELDEVVSFFDDYIQQHARPSEATAFDNLAKTARRSIDRNDKDFEYHLDELKGKNFHILWRQDWFVIERFKSMVNSPHLFADKHQFEEISKMGLQLLRSDDIDKLRQVVAELYQIMIRGGAEDDMFVVTNIIRG